MTGVDLSKSGLVKKLATDEAHATATNASKTGSKMGDLLPVDVALLRGVNP